MSRNPARDGVLPVDKTPGPTSHDVVARARRALDTRRVGHTGTLDPFASGLLVLCVGSATRLSEYLVGLPKTYRATVRLGVVTDTDDPEGDVLAESEAWRDLGRSEVEEALDAFRGRIRQVPPRYSAKKVGGERAHRRARRGEEVALEAVEVEIHELALVAFEPPDLEIRLRCSSGTYVRALGRDLGARLGAGAHLTALRRTAVGSFSVDGAVPAASLGDPGAVEEAWIGPAEALSHLPAVEVGEDEALRLAHGQAIRLDADVPDGGPRREAPDGGERGGAGERTVAVLRGPDLVAVADRDGDRLRPRKVFLRV